MSKYVYEMSHDPMNSCFDHENLRVYRAAIEFVAWLEDPAHRIPTVISACDHLIRASGGIPVNIAEASGKRSTNERNHLIDIAYGSSLECAACLDIFGRLSLLNPNEVCDGKTHLASIISMLIGFKKSPERQIRENHEEYKTKKTIPHTEHFTHEKLEVYRESLDFVTWQDQQTKQRTIPRGVAKTLDKTSTSIVLNIAEGNGRFSMKDRCRFIGIARTAALQSAATLDILIVRQNHSPPDVAEGKRILAHIVRMLVAWEKYLISKT